MALSAKDRALLFANAAILGLKHEASSSADADAAHAALAQGASKLAVYGTLAPGRENAHQLNAVGGVWRDGVSIPGVREAEGWDAGLGYPGVRWSPGAGVIKAWLLESENLPSHWPTLDEFEGEEYARLLTSVWANDAPIALAYFYAARESSAQIIRDLLDRDPRITR